MTVYRRGYTRYEGELTGYWTRLLVLPKFAWQQIIKQRIVTTILVAATFWPLACAVYVYVANRADLLIRYGFEPGFLKVDSTFFVVFMNTQSSFAIVLAALAGPSLIAPDLTNGALPLYFSRPMSRAEYVVARMLALLGMLSAVTWVPGVILFGMQSSLGGWGWFTANWEIGSGVFFGFLLWILLVGFVALASSAYVRWRIVAGALVLAVFFVLAGAAELLNEVLRVEWASAFNPGRAMNQIWRALLGDNPIPGPGAWQCFFAMGILLLVLLIVIERRLRPVQVVS